MSLLLALPEGFDVKMTISASAWSIGGALLLGLVAGFGLATYRQGILAETERELPERGNVDYEATYTNAVLFRQMLRQEPRLDSLFARELFFANAIRILRRDSTGIEALAIPRVGEKENYYLIRGDSVTQLWARPRKVR